MVTNRQKQTICEITGALVGTVGGMALGVYAAEAANGYFDMLKQSPDVIRYTLDTVSGVIGAGVGGLAGLMGGVATGQIVFNRPVKMNFGKSYARKIEEEYKKQNPKTE